MKQKEEINLREGNISLILDSYNDIFSDFDPRPYNIRALSEDFLEECKRASTDKRGELELRFLIPKNKRNIDYEYEIKKRLRNHFQKHHKEEEKEIKRIKRNGLAWFFLGAFVMFLSTYIYESKSFLLEFLFVMSQPASWFFFWEGLGKIFIEAKKKKPDYEFYKKMSKAHIYFLDY